jgi:predicted nuclease with TOPRIM domain
LQAENRRLKNKVAELEREGEELRAKLAGGNMSTNEFLTAIKKWEDTVETQRGIIARLENENASLRARVGAPPPADDGLDIPGFLLVENRKQGATP